MSNSKREPLTIMLMSGATGRTVNQVVESALAQFDSPNVNLVVKADVRTMQAARKIVREAAERNAVICHSVIAPKVRDALLAESRKRMVPTVDVVGPTLAMLSDHLGVAPRRRPGLAYKLQKDYFDRIEAVSYTLEHDDGVGLNTLADADVVLVGVSRSSKSVTCFYLAYRGIRAANVPLVLDCEPPEQLVKIPREKVIGMTVNVNRLKTMREARRQIMGRGPLEYYVDRDEIKRELRHAERLMRKHKWRRLDVSYMAIEEVAKHVLDMIGK